MIPFHKTFDTPASRKYIEQVLNSGNLGGDGEFGKQCEMFLEAVTGCEKALLTTSCSVALDMSARLINIKPEDEVLVPSYTFVTTANAFYNLGARVVFVDCSPGTLNMDVNHAASLITDRTRAIVPMHYGGVGCDMKSILDLADRHGLYVIEDAAQAFDGYYSGEHLGTFGHLATFSFHETKNISCGEGGALLINDSELIQRAKIIREKGTNRSQFLDGMIEKYSWIDYGSSYVQSEILSALLLGQLEKHKEIKEKRRLIWQSYYNRLKPLQKAGFITLPYIPEESDPSWHLFFILVKNTYTRSELIAQLKSAQIESHFHYLPLHLSTIGRQLGGSPGDCPNSEIFSETLIRLPFYTEMELEHIETVCNHIEAYYEN